MNIELPQYAKQLFTPKRYKILHGGRGGAKSWTVACVLLLMAGQKPLRVLCTREVQKSIKDSVYLLLSDTIKRLELSYFFTVLNTEIRAKNGSLFLFSGLREHTIDSIKSFEGVDIVWVEEAHSVTKRSWDILTKTIRRENSEIWITLNPNLETDETYQRFIVNPPDNAWVCQVNYYDNKWFPAVLEEERQNDEKRLPKDEYGHIWLGELRTTADGAIYREEFSQLVFEQRIKEVPYDALLPVYTVWDLGWNDAMSIILCQRDTSCVRIIGYIEDSHKTLDYYVSLLEKLPYRYGRDFLPHDGRTRNFQTGKSTEEILRQLGRNPYILDAMPVEDGIRNARMLFSQCYFDKDKTVRLVECLKRYKRRVDSNNVAKEPLHDDYSHGADA
ncbi:MAG: PBSX family phage terminase large subunit, partial [Neisseriaceae bacterium]|nr:PBSX family phage terminase large subunit [Neisseriaceae bacterium]